MKSVCSICFKEVNMPFTCKYCGYHYCSEHRLPEDHNCQGLKKVKKDYFSPKRSLWEKIKDWFKNE